MSTTTSEDVSGEGNQSNYMSEVALNNLKACKEGMIEMYNDFGSKAIEFELSDIRKYSVLANLKQRTTFEEDDEDLGVNEDLVLLNIK